MIDGLKTTFDHLAKSDNEAAAAVLVPCLDSANEHIQHEALRAILRRRSPTGGREVVRRLHQHAKAWHPILAEYPGRLAAALRDAVLGADSQMCENACGAILWFGEYDLMPVLINAAEDKSNPNAERSAATLIELAELLYQELAAPRDYRRRRDPQLVRQHVVSSLELSLGRYQRHKRREIIEAFLLLVNRDNAALKKIFSNPKSTCYLPVVDVLTNSPRAGVMRLMLSYLDDPHAPSTAVNVLAHRGDVTFLRHLMNKVGFEPSAAAAQNLKRMETIAWLRDDLAVLDEFDEAGQHAAVQIVMASGMKRLEAFTIVEHLLRNGNVGGRRAAAAALAEFSGADAIALTQEALEDPDPKVSAHALAQIRKRGVPGAMARLIDAVESPHEILRETARSALGEFNFERFLTAFELLDEGVRRSTGALVKKVDRNAIPALTAELNAPSRTRRLRAIEIALVMDAILELEQPLLELLAADDHMIRAEAARALGRCNTLTARCALTEAQGDRSVIVQEAAQESLVRLDQLAERAVGDTPGGAI